MDSAGHTEGEVCRAVGLIGGRHHGVRAGRKPTGQADVLGVAVRDTTGHQVLVTENCPFTLDLDTVDGLIIYIYI